MSSDCLKLTTYGGERDRFNGVFASDALLDLYERRGFATSVLLRGTEGFGLKQRLQTQRFLSLSEDLPLVTVAVDTRSKIEGALDELMEIPTDGLITLERARLLTAGSPIGDIHDALHEETKLTIYCGRRARANGRPTFVEAVGLLRRRGLAGATVLLGLDGTVHGRRRRARFFSSNSDVPLMIISIGKGEQIAAAAPELAELLGDVPMTIERVRVCKRDGRLLASPEPPPQPASDEPKLLQKLMIYAGEQSRHEGRPLYVEVIRRLRQAGASGATALRGIWGYHGDHKPHGDKLLSLRRHVPVVVVVIDTPDRITQLFETVDELTDETGLVTSEIVPAYRGAHPGGEVDAPRAWTDP